MSGLDAFGSALERSDMGSVPVFTEIANVTNIGGPSLSRNTIDMTAHDSPDAYMEFLGGLKDGGEVSMDINWDPSDSTHDATTGLLADFEDAVPRDYKLVLPDGTTEWAISAILTGFEPSYPTDDKISASVSFKITGKPALTVA